MKKLLFLQALLALVLAPLCSAELRTFMSADGSNELRGEIVAYNPKTEVVTLMLENRRQINSPVSAFSKDDQEFIKKAGLAMTSGRYLAVRFADHEETISEKKNPVNGYQTLQLKSGYGLEFRNNGEKDFKGLKVDYQIFYKAYLDPFKSRERTEKFAAGSVAIPDMKPREETSVKTDGVDMTRIRQLPRSECAGGT